MIIRGMIPTDTINLERIHNWYYKSEFEFPDFFNSYLCAFTVEAGDNRIISGGGVRPIAEIVLVTDKHYSTRIRREALYRSLEASCYVAKKSGFSKLHAVTEDETWANQMIRSGFHSRGNILAVNL